MALSQKRSVDSKKRSSPLLSKAAIRPPRQLRSEETLAKMLRAGRDLIGQHGSFDLVLISDVIRTAGTSTGAFYCRFKDKDAFLASVLEAAFTEIRADAETRFRDDPSWQAGTAAAFMAHIVRQYVVICRRNEGMFKAVLRHFASRAPDTGPLYWLDSHVQSLIAPALAQKMPGLSVREAEE
jgi:AcrR family transcriptional regulator